MSEYEAVHNKNTEWRDRITRECVWEQQELTFYIHDKSIVASSVW